MTTAPISIAADSFIAEHDCVDVDGDIVGTVELTMFGETRRVQARRAPKYGWIFAYGIEGMYRTGQKWWSGSVQLTEATGRINVRFGRYDNHPKFAKTNVRFKAA